MRKCPQRKTDVHRISGAMPVHWKAPLLFECSPWFLNLLVSELTSFFFSAHQHCLSIQTTACFTCTTRRIKDTCCGVHTVKAAVCSMFLTPPKSRTKVARQRVSRLPTSTLATFENAYFSLLFGVLAFHLQLWFLKTLSQVDK